MRLIDADEIPYVTTYREDWMNNTTTEDQCAWKSNIDAMPTIEERKKGRWILNSIAYIRNDIAVPGYRCSECGSITTVEIQRFCHWCGADMRGEDDEETQPG